MNDRISVVIPAYNAAGTVKATLDSLFAQTVTPSEIIVVDDGSRDATREVLEAYRDRVTLLFQTNSGPSATRNRGVREAHGDWVAFCDADDVWHPEKLQVLTRVLAQCRDDLVFHDFWTIVDDRVVEPRATHSAGTMFPIFREVAVSIPEILPDHRRVDTGTTAFPIVDTWSGQPFRWLIVGNFLMPSTVAMRRSSFLAAGGFDPEFRYAEDTEFFLRFGKQAGFTWIDASLCGYRQAPGTLLTGNMLPTIRNGTRAVVKHCIDDAEVLRSDRRWVSRAVSRRLSRLAYFCLTELQTAEAWQHATHALSYSWRDRRAWGVAVASRLPVAWLRAARRVKARLVG